MKRSSGILLSISSLPSRYGIGCFDSSAYSFVDFLKSAGQSYWQILPLGVTGFGDSPYQSFSTFAGNPYYINLEEFIKDGLLTLKECENCDFGQNECEVDYEKLYKNRYTLLKKAYEKSDLTDNVGFINFCNEDEWLNEYSLFMALKDRHMGAPFYDWEEDLILRDDATVKKYEEELSYEINFHKFLQYRFYGQFSKLKKYANENGIKIIGDIPIYVALDSSDTWANPKLFRLDENKKPIDVAGCPPDAFSKDGQLWGNPLYDWDGNRENVFAWWIKRLKHCFKMYDVLRIDHFRGFDEYYSIPYGEKTAKNGVWKKGPSYDLFDMIKKSIGEKEMIAEDLGFMTDSVRELVVKCGFPNMKVLEFAFDSRDTGGGSEHMPHTYCENCVAYTGTHDNQTLSSWLDTISKEDFNLVRDYLCDNRTLKDELNKCLIALIMRSKASLCIIPMQDWLGLDDKSRMNVPSTVGQNWKWRLKQSDITDDLVKEILHMTNLFDRNTNK